MKDISTPPRSVGYWLLAMAGAIFLMVVIGGGTRLTESGLSITEWKPISGVVPPLDTEAWTREFERYQQFPQYQKANPDMDLTGFKQIYWWEYVHRLWGRLLGVLFLVPFLYFLFTKKLCRKWVIRLGAAFIVGGLQGLLGWVMVQSGLVDKPWVSPYRLTAHLLLALFLFGYILWAAWDILRPVSGSVASGIKRWIWLVAVMLVLQISWGGFMAGTRSALSYPTFPKMNGQWIPESFFKYDSLIRHLCEHPAAIHMVHRYLAVLLSLAILMLCGLGMAAEPSRTLKKGYQHLLGAVLLQFVLGVLTVSHSVGRIPVTLGVMHQGMSVLVLASLLYVAHQAGLIRSKRT